MATTSVEVRSASVTDMPPVTDENAEARTFALEASLGGICDVVWARMCEGKAPHFGYPLGHPVITVKHGGPWRQAEADMQRLAWQWARDEHQAGRCSPGIYIPEAFRTFTDPHTNIFVIIMELVKGTVLAKSVYAYPWDVPPTCSARWSARLGCTAEMGRGH